MQLWHSAHAKAGVAGLVKDAIFFSKKSAHPGNRTPVSTVGGYYDTTTPDAPSWHS